MRTLFPPYAYPAPGTAVDPDTTVVLAAPGNRAPVADAVALGHVDLGFAGRSLADVLTDLDRWTEAPVAGLFLDRAPAGELGVGPVALALRVARRRGLHRLVLNPGVPVHRAYRDLGVAICTFDGSWQDYQRWAGDGARPGDGHLVHGVPFDQLTAARQLLACRGAGFGLATDVPAPAR